MGLSKKTIKRLSMLEQALLDEAELKRLLPGGFSMSHGAVKTDCGTAGCIAGMAWTLSVGVEKARRMAAETAVEDSVAGYWDYVQPAALEWLGVERLWGWKSPPLFATKAETTEYGVLTKDVTPEQAAAAIREVIAADNFHHNPWAKVLGKTA